MNVLFVCVYVAIDNVFHKLNKFKETLARLWSFRKILLLFVLGASVCTCFTISCTIIQELQCCNIFGIMVCIVSLFYDDLTKHADCISPNGTICYVDHQAVKRYPGDVFYLHSRLIRTCWLNYLDDVGAGSFDSITYCLRLKK